MTRDQIVEAARHWIAAWNARDLDGVLGHFEESACFTSPKAVATMGRATVEGRAALRAYWEARLKQIRSLRFTLDRVLWDADQRTAIIVYVAEIEEQRVPRARCSAWGKGAGRWRAGPCTGRLYRRLSHSCQRRRRRVGLVRTLRRPRRRPFSASAGGPVQTLWSAFGRKRILDGKEEATTTSLRPAS